MPEWLRAEMPPPKRRERLPPPAQQVSSALARAEPLLPGTSALLVLRSTHLGAVIIHTLATLCKFCVQNSAWCRPYPNTILHVLFCRPVDGARCCMIS